MTRLITDIWKQLIQGFKVHVTNKRIKYRGPYSWGCKDFIGNRQACIELSYINLNIHVVNILKESWIDIWVFKDKCWYLIVQIAKGCVVMKIIGSVVIYFLWISQFLHKISFFNGVFIWEKCLSRVLIHDLYW